MVKSTWVVRVVSLVLWSIPVIFFGYLTIRYTALTGTYEYIWTPQDRPDENIQPLGRASKPFQDVETGEVFQRITGDPVYLTLEVPRTFNAVTATVDLHNSGQPLVELGLQNSAEWQFDLHPLDVPLLEDLNWSRLEDEQGNVLFQRHQQFQSIQAFLDDIPVDQRIAQYFQDLRPDFVFDSYVQKPELHITSPLRGSHTFVGYVKQQPVSIDLSYVDLNRQFDVDTVTLSIVQDNQVIAQGVAEDDGSVVADGQVSVAQTLHLETETPIDGKFTIEIRSTDDLLLTSFETNFGYLVSRSLYLAGNPEYRSAAPTFNTSSTTLVSNTTMLQAVTSHPVGLQTIQIGEEELPLLKVNSPEHLDLPDDRLKSILVPHNDVVLNAGGWMAFTPDSFFDPDYLIERLTPTTDLEQIDFVYAADLPQHTVTETARSVTFDLTELPGDKKELNFILSAPGLDQRKAEITVSSIRFEFKRPPLTLHGIFSRLYQRIFQ